MYFNGQKVHKKIEINQVWGGPNSGIDGGNDGGKGITDTPGGIKLQCEGHDVRYRNTWIKELDLKDANTDFDEPLALLTIIPKTENIHMLFDGEHFDEWNVDPERWRLVDGMIQGKVLQQKQMYSYIFTHKGYRNFRLLLEVKQLIRLQSSLLPLRRCRLGEEICQGNRRLRPLCGPRLFCFVAMGTLRH